MFKRLNRINQLISCLEDNKNYCSLLIPDNLINVCSHEAMLILLFHAVNIPKAKDFEVGYGATAIINILN